MGYVLADSNFKGQKHLCFCPFRMPYRFYFLCQTPLRLGYPSTTSPPSGASAKGTAAPFETRVLGEIQRFHCRGADCRWQSSSTDRGESREVRPRRRTVLNSTPHMCRSLKLRLFPDTTACVFGSVFRKVSSISTAGFPSIHRFFPFTVVQSIMIYKIVID